MPELKNPTQALTAALLLAVTVPHESIAAEVVAQAELIAGGMPPADVDRVRDVIEVALAMLTPEGQP
jgi:hypothetical protein